MLAEELFYHGLSRSEAEALSNKIESAIQKDSQYDFAALSKEFLRPEYPFCIHEFLYKRFAKDDIVWRPDINEIDNSNLTQLIEKLGVNTVEEVYGFSVDNPNHFFYRLFRYSCRDPKCSAVITEGLSDGSNS